MKWKKSKRFQKLFAFALAVWMACLPVSTSIPVAYAAAVSTVTKEVPFELNSEANLIEALINDTDNAGITYNASDKKVTIPSGAPVDASVELEFTFKLSLSKEAEVYTDDASGETTMVSSAVIKENGTYFRKYTCKHTAEVGELFSLTDMKIVPKLNIDEASTGTIQFLDEAGQPITDISTYADVTYADSAWQKTGWTYYRSVDGADDGAQVTITPKPLYEYASCSLGGGRVVKNNNGSVTLQIRDEDVVTVTLKPLTVSAPEANALVWTDELAEEQCNSKSKRVTVTLMASEEAVNRGYVLQYWKCTDKEDSQTTGAAFRTSLNANGDAYSFVIEYPYNPNDTVDKVVYIAYRYKKEFEDGTSTFSDIVWNDTPIRSDFAPPSGSEIQVEANGKTVWTQDSQAPAWINQEQESSCAVKLKIVDAMSGGGKITYGMKDGSGNAYAQNQESQAVNNVCTIPYTTSVLLGTSADTVELTYTMQDKVGNTAAEQTVTLSDMVQFDLTAPTVTAAYQDASGQPITDISQWQTGEVRLIITAEDPAGTSKEKVSGIDRLVVVDTISGVAEDISDKVTKNQDGTYTLKLAANAAYQLSITAYDKAGNCSAKQSVTQFDLTAPTVTAAYQDASGQPITDISQWQTGEVRLIITAEDPAGTSKEKVSGIDRLVVVDTISGVAEDISDKVTKNQDGTYTLKLAANAAYNLSITAYDKAGNCSAKQSVTQFDLTAPTVTAAYQDASGQPITDFSQWQTGEVRLIITAEDPAGTSKEKVSGIDRLVVMDTVSGVLKDLSQNVTDNQNGTYTLWLSESAAHQLLIVAYDKAGNDSTEIKQEIRIDKALSTVSKNEGASQFTEPFTIYAQAGADSGNSEDLIAARKSVPVKKSVNDNTRDVDNDTQIDENAEAESIETGTEEKAEETEAAGAASDTVDTDGSENRRNNMVLPLVVAGCGGTAAVTGGAYWFLRKKRI